MYALENCLGRLFIVEIPPYVSLSKLTAREKIRGIVFWETFLLFCPKFTLKAVHSFYRGHCYDGDSAAETAASRLDG